MVDRGRNSESEEEMAAEIYRRCDEILMSDKSDQLRLPCYAGWQIGRSYDRIWATSRYGQCVFMRTGPHNMIRFNEGDDSVYWPALLDDLRRHMLLDDMANL